MRKYYSFIFAIGLIASPSAWADPLAAGKPAGGLAQISTGSMIVAAGLGAVVVGVVAAAVSGGGDNNSSSQSTSATSSTTTTS